MVYMHTTEPAKQLPHNTFIPAMFCHLYFTSPLILSIPPLGACAPLSVFTKSAFTWI